MAASALWIFGYGSLIWRPAFAHEQRRPAHVRGFVRRFWQASPDHRGTPNAPGRVVTLVPDALGICHGAAYRVAESERERVLANLDHREKAGYRRVETTLHFNADDGTVGLVYMATEGNPNFVGPTPVEEIAAVARARVGPSGTNREYVVRLARALREMGASDPHVEELASLVGE